MAIIYSYPLYAPKPEDLLIGTVTLDENAAVPIYDNPTVSFTIQSIVDLIAPKVGLQDLQSVTTVGATTTNTVTFSSDIKVTGRIYDSGGGAGNAGNILSSLGTGTAWIANTPGGVTSVGQSHEGNAFSVAGTPITSAGTLAIEMEGSAFQYINGLGNLVLLSTLPQGAVETLTTTGTSGVSTLTSGVLNIPNYANTQNSLTTTGTGAATLVNTVLNIPTPVITFTSLTTTGTSGASSLAGGVLNVPNYANDNDNTTYDFLAVGTIPTFTLNTGTTNTGYTTAVNLATTVSPTGGSGMTVNITAVSGNVTAVVINNPGVGYDIGDIVTITQAGSSGDATITLSGTVGNVDPNLRLIDNAFGFDDIKITGTNATTVTRTSDNGITINSDHQTLLGTGSDNSDSGIILNQSGGTVKILGDGTVITSARSGNTITLTGVNTWVANSLNVAGYVAAPGAVASKVWKTDASGNPAWRDDETIPDTGITSVVVNTGADKTEPLAKDITGRVLTLTSNVFGGGAKIGYVPAGGTVTTYLKGDGSWQAIPTGLIFKGTWNASGTTGGNPDLTALTPADGWLYIVSVAGDAEPNGAAGTQLSPWAVGDWCVYNGTEWTRIPSSTAGVTTVDTTNGTYINLTPITATGGNVVVTADLNTTDASGAVPFDSLFLRKDNKWSTAITEVVPLFGLTPNYGGITVSPDVTTATYLNTANITTSTTLTLTAVNAAIAVNDVISGDTITAGTLVSAIDATGLIITMDTSNVIAQNATLVYTRPATNNNSAGISLNYYGGSNMILSAEPAPVDNTTNPPTYTYPSYTTDEMLWTQASGGAAKNVYRSRLEDFPFAPITASGTVKSVTGLSIITTNGSGNGGGIEVTGSINVDPIVSVKYDLPTVIGTDTRWNIIDAAAPAGGFSNINDSILVLQTQSGGTGTVGKQPLSKLPFYDNVFVPATEFIRTDNQQVTNSVTIVFNNSTATIEQGMQVIFTGMVGTPTVSSVTINPNFSIILTGSNQSISAGTSITFKGVGEIGVVPAPTIATLADQDGYFLNSNADWSTAVTNVAELTLGTNGTDLSSTVANPTGSAVISLQVPSASSTNRGVLTATNWTTFNNKVTSVNATASGNGTGGIIVDNTDPKNPTVGVKYTTGGGDIVTDAFAQSGAVYAGGSFTSTARTQPTNQILVYNKALATKRVEFMDIAELPFAPYTASGTVTGVVGLAVANTTPASNGAGQGGGITVSGSASIPTVSVKYDLPNIRATDTIWNVIEAAPPIIRTIHPDCEILVLERNFASALGTVQRHKISDLPATTISNFTVSTASAVGTAGLVPAPAIATQGGTYYLNGNATFTVPPNTMGTGFTVSADTNTATTTITQGDALTLTGGTNVTTVSDPDGTITINSTDQYTGTVTSVGVTSGGSGVGGLKTVSGSAITGAGTIGVKYVANDNIIMDAESVTTSGGFVSSDEFIMSVVGTPNEVRRDTLGQLKTWINSGQSGGTVTSVTGKTATAAGNGGGITVATTTSNPVVGVYYGAPPTSPNTGIFNVISAALSSAQAIVADDDEILIQDPQSHVTRRTVSLLPFTNNTGTVESVGGTAPIVSSGGINPAISIPVASGSTNGYLSSANWTTFNNKTSNTGTVTGVTGTAPVVSSGGTAPVISMGVASGSANGYLSSTNWTTFNNKTSNLGTVTGITLAAGSGTGSAINTSGTFTFTGGTNVTTSVSGTTVTINSTDQYVGTVTSSSATANVIPKFSSGTNVTNSAMTDSGTGITLTSTSGNYGFTVTDGSGFKHTAATSAQIGFHAQYTGGSTGTLFRGTNGASTTVFDVTSGGIVTAAGDIVALSDQRLKSNIETLDGSKVYEMRGVSFDKDGKKGSGVIAQEMEKVAPELVNNDNEYKAVAYGNISGYLIEAIKELKQEIEELKNKSCNCNCK